MAASVMHPATNAGFGVKSPDQSFPPNLQDLCISSITRNSSTCSKVGEKKKSRSSRYSPLTPITLPTYISERLLTSFMEHHMLNDDTMQVFENRWARLVDVKIEHVPLTRVGLKVLKKHKLTELRLRQIEASIDQILSPDVLSKCTEKSLRVLSLADLMSTHASGKKAQHAEQKLMRYLATKFTNLSCVSLINVELSDTGLKALCENISPNVTTLDISENSEITDIMPLGCMRDSLQTLIMFNVLPRLKSINFNVLTTKLHRLQHLDISQDTEPRLDEVIRGCVGWEGVESLLESADSSQFRSLVSLDLSGWKGVKAGVVRKFLSCHQQVKFIGLLKVEAATADVFTDPSHPGYSSELKVGSLVSEENVLECLSRYKHRHHFVQKSLLELFQITRDMLQPRPDLVLLLVDIIWRHIGQPSVMLAATACLYNLTKMSLVSELHPHCLTLMVQSVLECMKRYPTNEALQKNCLLTICSDRILNEVTFDKYKCIELALECLCKFTDATNTRMCLAVTSILAAKVPIDAITDLASNSKYMMRIIEITKEKAARLSTDCIMRFALSALWNLTDESPKACHCFYKLNGLDLALSCLKAYGNLSNALERLQIQVKVVGLLNNVAEVADLREHLITPSFIQIFRESLRSEDGEYAYFSGGILANLLCNINNPAWKNLGDAQLDHLLDEMVSAISLWPEPASAMVAYRCFGVFKPLLAASAPAASQYWALWAINHVCRKDSNKYVRLVHSSHIFTDIKRISQQPHSLPLIHQLAQSLSHFIDYC